MANLGSVTDLKDDSIDTNVTTNGQRQNTGARVNTTLNDIVDTLTGSPVVSTGVANVNSVFASAAQGLLANSALQPEDVLPVALNGVLTGRTIWVDSVNGDDNTAVVGRQDLPFETLNAAQTAASTGYTVIVRPGTYDERVVLSDINFHFENGAILHYTGTSTGQAFGDDLVSPATCKVTGWGVFRHSGLPDTGNPTDNAGPYNGVVGSINENSDWYFECLRIDGDQQNNVGAAGLVIDCGTFNFLVRDELTSSIYDALLNSGDVLGTCVTSGHINRITTTIDADNAIEFVAGSAMMSIGSIVHGNPSVNSINGIGPGTIISCGSIIGSGPRLLGGTLTGCLITLTSEDPDPTIHCLSLGGGSGTVGRISNCRVVQSIDGLPSVLLSGGTTNRVIDGCTIIAGDGATESISSDSPLDVVCYASYANVAVGADVNDLGSLTVGAYVV